jgi:hypothetical protein
LKNQKKKIPLEFFLKKNSRKKKKDDKFSFFKGGGRPLFVFARLAWRASC